MIATGSLSIAQTLAVSGYLSRSTAPPKIRFQVRVAARQHHRIGDLDPVWDARRVEEQLALRLLIRDAIELEGAEHHHLARVGPDLRRVLDGVVVLGELHAQ